MGAQCLSDLYRATETNHLQAVSQIWICWVFLNLGGSRIMHEQGICQVLNFWVCEGQKSHIVWCLKIFDFTHKVGYLSKYKYFGEDNC